MANKTEEEKMMSMMANRVSFSIFVIFLSVVFLVWWLFFSAENYSIYQNIAVILMAIIVPVGLLGAAWAGWGIRYSNRWEKYEKKHKL